jgi:hypothetical protein
MLRRDGTVPLRIGGRTYADFDAAVRAVMKARGWSMDRAKRYVASIQRAQEGKDSLSGTWIQEGHARVAAGDSKLRACFDHAKVSVRALDAAGAPLWREENGVFIAPARITRDGVMNGYHKSPEEIVKAFEAHRGAEIPLTFLHTATVDPPPERVIGWGRDLRLVLDEELMPILELDYHIPLTGANASVVADIKAGELTDNSIGFWADLREESGEYRGRAYQAAQENLKIGHVAVLFNGDGACGSDQGCVIRVTSNDGQGTTTTGNGAAGVPPGTQPPTPAPAGDAATKGAGAPSAAAPPAAAPAPAQAPVVLLDGEVRRSLLKSASMDDLLTSGNKCAIDAKASLAQMDEVKKENAELKKLKDEHDKRVHAAYDAAIKKKAGKAFKDEELAKMDLQAKELVLKAVGLDSTEVQSGVPLGALAPAKPANQTAAGPRARTLEFKSLLSEVEKGVVWVQGRPEKSGPAGPQ